MKLHNTAADAVLQTYAMGITPDVLKAKLDFARNYYNKLNQLANGSDSDSNADDSSGDDLELVLPFLGIDFMKQQLKADFDVVTPELAPPAMPNDYLQILLNWYNHLADEKAKKRAHALECDSTLATINEKYIEEIFELGCPDFEGPGDDYDRPDDYDEADDHFPEQENDLESYDEEEDEDYER